MRSDFRKQRSDPALQATAENRVIPERLINETSERIRLQLDTMPKRYTSRELIKLAEDFGWRLAGAKGDHRNYKHPESRFVVTIVHPQKDVPVGRAVDTVKKIRLEVK